MNHSIRTRMALMCTAVALASAAALTAVAQVSPAPVAGVPSFPPGMTASERITVMNNAMEQMRKFLWQAQPVNTPLKDSRGRTFKDDIADYMLPPAVSERLDKLAEQAKSQAGDDAALNGTAAEMEALLRTEMAKMVLMSTYWSAHFMLTHHRTLLDPWLAKASDADREAIRAHLATTEKAISDELQTGLTQDADTGFQTTLKMQDQLNEAAAFYNGRRSIGEHAIHRTRRAAPTFA